MKVVLTLDEVKVIMNAHFNYALESVIIEDNAIVLEGDISSKPKEADASWLNT